MWGGVCERLSKLLDSRNWKLIRIQCPIRGAPVCSVPVHSIKAEWSFNWSAVLTFIFQIFSVFDNLMWFFVCMNEVISVTMWVRDNKVRISISATTGSLRLIKIENATPSAQMQRYFVIITACMQVTTFYFFYTLKKNQWTYPIYFNSIFQIVCRVS